MVLSSNATPVIRTRDLTRRFGHKTVVDRLSLTIERQQIYGFLGPNGSGKSTTIRMLCGLLKPQGGEIEVLGHAIPRAAAALKKEIGYMTQQFSLYQDLSVRENLSFVATVYGFGRSTGRERVQELLARYRLTELAHQLAGTLSGGQRQRLALAAAVIHRPALLFLDEPTAGVDPQSRRDFWESLFELVEEGTTILVTTHYMDEAERCHRLCILNQGVKRADDTPRALTQGLGAEVWELDIAPNAEHPGAAGHNQGLIRRLLAVSGVRSVTQFGTRLRILGDRGRIGLDAPVEQLLAQTQHQGRYRLKAVPSNLEDVFVASTRSEPNEASGAT